MPILGFIIFFAIFLPIHDFIIIKMITGKDFTWWLKYDKYFKETSDCYYPKK